MKTSKEALEKLFEYANHEYYAKDYYSIIKKDLEMLELIRYAREHSTEGRFNLPNGKQYSCDMGYVEDFLRYIEQEV